jgi:hypothetical protein
VWQEDGKLRCPAGASLWLSEVRQEHAFTEAQPCTWPTRPIVSPVREQCLAPGAKGNRARRVSVARRLLPQASALERQPMLLGPMQWVDVGRVGQGARFVAAGLPDFRRQYVEVLPLPQTLPKTTPPPRPPRAVRQAPELPLASPAQPQCLVGTPASAYQWCRCARFSRQQLTQQEWPTKGAFSRGSIFL